MWLDSLLIETLISCILKIYNLHVIFVYNFLQLQIVIIITNNLCIIENFFIRKKYTFLDYNNYIILHYV